MLARVQREHEVDERPREARAVAHQEGEPRPRDPGGPLEVDDAERGPEVPVRLRLEVERARLADPPHLQVVGGALPDRDARGRQVRDRQQQRRTQALDLLEVRLEPLDLLAALAVGGEHGARVAPFLLRPRHVLARLVLLPLEFLDLDDGGPAAGVVVGERAEVGVGVDAAVPQAGPHEVEVVADEVRIEHGSIDPKRLGQRRASRFAARRGADADGSFRPGPTSDRMSPKETLL